MLTWERARRPFFARQELSQQGLGLALVQGSYPPPPLEWLIDFCGQDRLCPGVAGKVFAAGHRSIALFPAPSPLIWKVGMDTAQRPEQPDSLSGCDPSLLWLKLPQARRISSLWEEGGVFPLEEQDLG